MLYVLPSRFFDTEEHLGSRHQNNTHLPPKELPQQLYVIYNKSLPQETENTLKRNKSILKSSDILCRVPRELTIDTPWMYQNMKIFKAVL